MYNEAMKRRPSIKGRRRFSDSGDGADQYRSASIEPSRSPRRKQIEYLDTGVEERRRAWDWDDAGLEFIEQQPRR